MLAPKNFVNLIGEQFEEFFECYKQDLKRDNLHRPWDDLEEQKNIKETQEKSNIYIEGGIEQ